MEHKIAGEGRPGTAMPDILIVIAVSAAAFIAELWAREAGFVTLGKLRSACACCPSVLLQIRLVRLTASSTLALKSETKAYPVRPLLRVC